VGEWYQSDGGWTPPARTAAPSQPGGVIPNAINAASAFQPAVQSQGRPDSQANGSADAGAGPGPVTPAAALPRSGRGTTGTEPPNPDQAGAGGAADTVGAPASAVKDEGQAGGGISNGPIGSAATNPVAHLSSLANSAPLQSGGLAPPGNASAANQGLVSGGPAESAHKSPERAAAATNGRAVGTWRAGEAARLGGGATDEFPRPSSADLITSVLPFDRASLDRAIARFFQQFEDLYPRDSVANSPAKLVLFSLAVASGLMALEATWRRWRRGTARRDSRVQDPLDREELAGFPELPRSWTARLS
jgi:hypothetical protein